MNTPRSLTSAGVMAACFLLVALAMPARAATPSLEIRSTAVAADGSVRAVVAVEGLPADTPVTPDHFTVTDGGGPVRDLRIAPLTASALSVVLVIDTSASTVGRPIASAIAAASRFVDALPVGTTLAVVATGAPARVVQAPTTDTAIVRSGLAGLRASGGAALYDGLAIAAGTLAAADGQRNAVVISNGRDTVSSRKMRAGVAALVSAKFGTTVIGLKTPDHGGNDGSITIARASGGTFVKVSATTGLVGAFTQVAKTLASQYAVSYSVTRTAATQFDLRIGLAGTSIVDTVTLLAPVTAVGALPRASLAPPVVDKGPWFAPFAAPLGLGVGLAAVFLAGLFLFGPLLLPTPDRAATRSLRRAFQGSTDREGARHPDALEGVITSVLGRAAVGLIEKRMPGGNGVDGLQFALVRSGWPLRAAEFRVVQGAAMLAGALVGFGVLHAWWLGLALAVLGAAVPQAILRRKIEARQRAFLKQLPTALDILASSLQAGLSFMQALDGLVQELPDPSAAEFGRVIAESRLGLPVEESLEASAIRIGAEDFTWVVMAIVIQRRAGGNLAHLMRTVATTLRERAQVRQQIRTLSSEGRLSAVILIVLPFLLSGYIMIVNPGYIGKLFEVRIGQYMVAGALTLMGAGVLWMRKIIRIDI